ncbi:MAG: AAA family ATPase [Arachnia sp.]
MSQLLSSVTGMRINKRPVRRVEAVGDVPQSREWPWGIPAVRQLLSDGLDLGDLTVFVGENGAGKSTLVEGIAMAYGLNAEGGGTGAMHRTAETESPLHAHLQIVRGLGPKWGYFVRGETLHGLWTYLSGRDDFHAMSHGQSILRLLTDPHRFGPKHPGLIVLDEPESGLSYTSQLAVCEILQDLVKTGSQVLMATHSPILAGIRDADIWQLDDDGMTRAAWEDLDVVRLHRRYLEWRAEK